MIASLRILGLLGVLAFSSWACGGPTTSEPQKLKVKTCLYDFDVEITSGPSAGMKFKGKMQIGEHPYQAGTLIGAFTPEGTDAKKFIKVAGSFTQDSVTVNFAFPDGKFISGYGPLSKGAYCEKIEGIAIGPTTAKNNTDPKTFDQGHWLATTFQFQEVIAVDFSFNGVPLTTESSTSNVDPKNVPACTTTECLKCRGNLRSDCNCCNASDGSANGCFIGGLSGCSDSTGSINTTGLSCDANAFTQAFCVAKIGIRNLQE